MKAHNLPRPYRLMIPPECVPTIDALKASGLTNKAIGAHIGVHWRTVSYALCRLGAYKDIPFTQPESEQNDNIGN